jgi:hypothetical protein
MLAVLSNMNKLIATMVMHAALLAACRDPDPPTSEDAGSAVAVPEGGSPLDASSGADAADSGEAAPRADARTEAGPGSDTVPTAEAGVEAGQPASDLDLERRAIEQAKACGFYEPSQDPVAYAVRDEFDRCLTRCWLAASCADIDDYLCEDALNALDRCVSQCPWQPPDGFRCADGSLVPHALVCNLEADCPDQEDEVDCGEFRCSNGERIPASSARCDGWEDCLDGSDERACASSC